MPVRHPYDYFMETVDVLVALLAVSQHNRIRAVAIIYRQFIYFVVAVKSLALIW